MAAPDTRCKVVVRRLPPSLQVGLLSLAITSPETIPDNLETTRTLPSELRAFSLGCGLQEDAFKETVEDWFDRVDWFSYVQGKTRCVAGAARRHSFDVFGLPAVEGCRMMALLTRAQSLRVAAPRNWCIHGHTCGSRMLRTCHAFARPGTAMRL
jgi:hypothetical protein